MAPCEGGRRVAKGSLARFHTAAGQAAAAVADRAPNRHRPSEAPPMTAHRLYAIWRAGPGTPKIARREAQRHGSHTHRQRRVIHRRSIASKSREW